MTDIPNSDPEDGEFQNLPVQGLSGIFIDILKFLSQDLNFTYSLKRRTDGAWGRPVNINNDTSWDGMIGSLLAREATFIAASLTMRHQRQKVIDFAFPVGTETRALFINRKHPEEFAWKAYFYPFTDVIWPILFGLTLIALINGLVLSSEGRDGRRDCTPIVNFKLTPHHKSF